VGEIAQPGASLFSIVNLDTLDMTIYVPQDQLPRVQIGAPVKVYVDAYPGEVFAGEVVNIAQQAQFSSRDTQNKEDRTNIVFAVVSFGYKYGIPIDADLLFDVRFLPNPHYDLRLRPLTGLGASSTSTCSRSSMPTSSCTWWTRSRWPWRWCRPPPGRKSATI